MTGGLIVLYAVYGLVSFLISIKLMTHSAGWVVLHDNEQYGVWNATRDASDVFRAASARFLIFELSFRLEPARPSRRSISASCSACLGLTVIGGGLGIAVMAVF